MKGQVTFPIRLKLLTMMLIVVTAVVSVITFSIVTLFQKDKTTYLSDLTSVTALHLAEETNTVLLNYTERLSLFAETLFSDEITESDKEGFLKTLVSHFTDVLAISLVDQAGKPQLSLHDESALKDAGLAQEDLANYRRQHPPSIEDLTEGAFRLQKSQLSTVVPSFTLIHAVKDPVLEEHFFVVAEMRLSRLAALGGKSKIFQTFLLDDQGLLLASSQTLDDLPPEYLHQTPIVVAFLKQKAFAETLEYDIEDERYLGAYARTAFAGFGAIAQIPKSIAYLAAKELTNTLLTVALGVLAFSILIAFLWSLGLTRPIQKLSEATRRVAAGEFDIQVSAQSRDEIGLLANAFNHMALELKTREFDLKSAQAALIQSEKMAAFGQLGAGIAHEVKNPLAGILGYAQLALRKADKDSLLAKQLKTIEKETKRCKNIIDNLMRFSRQEKTEKTPTDLNKVVEDTVAIVDHQLSLNKVRIEKTLGLSLPPIGGNGNQLQQVIMNLMINAQQAMSEGGVVEVITECCADTVQIKVKDNGPGMPAAIQEKIFEPFFTTKVVGKGTGLGLSVSYGIVKDHFGEITLESEEGKGSTFTLSFPMMTDQSKLIEEKKNMNEDKEEVRGN